MMGKIKLGAKRGFSGKAGRLIESSWKNIEYSKGEPKTSNKHSTQGQLEQQARFARAVRFLKLIKDLLNITCGSIKEGRATGFNIAIRMVLAKSVPGDYSDYSNDYAAASLSYGSQAEARGSASSVAGGILKGLSGLFIMRPFPRRLKVRYVFKSTSKIF